MQAIYLVGAAQGLFLAAVLASRERNILPNRMLAGVMFVFSIDLAMAVYHSSGLSARFPNLIGLDLPIAFLYGPLLYLYVRTLTEGQEKLSGRDWLHFAPFVLVAISFVPTYLQTPSDKLLLLADPLSAPQADWIGVVNPLKLIVGGVYVAMIVYTLKRHRTRLRDNVSSVEHMQLLWLRNLTIGTVGLLTVAATVYVLGGHATVVGMDPGEFYDDLTLLAVTIFVYAVGYFGLRQPEVAIPSPEDSSTGSASYKRSGMDVTEAGRLRERLINLMETERPYTRGDLTLQELASALAISPHNLTEVLNTQVGERFYDFVNGYRVREVKRRLGDAAYADWTVLAIGLDAGFNAKSSFNAAFKKHTGMTPSQYRAQSANMA